MSTSVARVAGFWDVQSFFFHYLITIRLYEERWLIYYWREGSEVILPWSNSKRP